MSNPIIFYPPNLPQLHHDFWQLFLRMDDAARCELLTELRELSAGNNFAADFLPLFAGLPREWQTAVVENLAQNYA